MLFAPFAEWKLIQFAGAARSRCDDSDKYAVSSARHCAKGGGGAKPKNTAPAIVADGSAEWK